MGTIKKMKLVDINAAPAVKAQPVAVRPVNTLTNPYMSKLSQIDDQLTSAVQDNDIAGYEAAFHEYLKTYKRLKEQQSTSIAPHQSQQATSSVEHQSTHATESEQQEIDKLYGEAIASVPKSLRKNAERLVDFVKQSPDLSINRKGELKVKDGLIQGSHIEDLVANSVRKRLDSQSVPGLTEFHEVLWRANIPKTIVPQSVMPNTPRRTRRQPSPSPEESSTQRQSRGPKRKGRKALKSQWETY